MSTKVRVAALTQKLVIVDGHIDLPFRLDRQLEQGGAVDDPSGRTASGHFDFERARAGGLNAAFMAIYVPAEYQRRGGARAKADQLIDLVEALGTGHPQAFRLVRTPDEILEAKAGGLVALPMGIENGAALEDDVSNVQHFYRRGVRYITLTHSMDNRIGDSSYDSRRSHRGLSEFGKRVVAEMNRVGMMVDVSHVTDAALDDVLAVADAPPIASHSSCRRFTPGWERNINDASIQKLAAAGGIVMINFGADFLVQKMRDAKRSERRARQAFVASAGLSMDDPRVTEFLRVYRAEHPLPLPTARDVADHIDHVVGLVGIDHVGLGSDYDGVPDVPADLADVSCYPVLLEELLRRGYTEPDLEKIMSGNIFRVWRAVER